MHIRALFCCLLLIAQPVVAAVDAFQPMLADSAASGHCDTRAVDAELTSGASQHQGEHGDSVSPDCMESGSCNMCGACALLLSISAIGHFDHVRPVNSQVPTQLLPSVMPELLYRPPITS